jgi:DNA-binding FrmR family transcriptional regulator/rhodanese-related sulfurtransferase
MGKEKSYEILSPRDCKKLIDENEDIIILDVRSQMEYDFEGRLENAILLDYMKPRIFKREIQVFDREAKYLVYCAVGKSSTSACEQMVELGFKHVYEMHGGLKKWQKDQDLVTTVSRLDCEEIIEKRKKIVVRLNKLEGQISGVKRMLADGEYCGDILNQSLAAKAALNGVNKEIMEMFSLYCINSPEQKEDFYRYLNKLIN